MFPSIIAIFFEFGYIVNSFSSTTTFAARASVVVVLTVTVTRVHPTIFLFVVSASLFALVSKFRVSSQQDAMVALPFVSLPFATPGCQLSFTFSH